MRYYVLNTATNIPVGRKNTGYKTEAAAKAARTRILNGDWDCGFRLALEVVAEADLPTRKVRNLMTGKEVEVRANTPLCCDPSSETYWSM